MNVFKSLIDWSYSQRLESLDQVVKNFVKRAHSIPGVEGQTIEILDIGAGNAPVWQSPLFKELAIRLEVTCFDAVDQNLDVLPNAGMVKLKSLNGLAPVDLQRIPDKSFDIVCAFDLIEHLSKEEGYLLLYEIDRIQRHGSMIYTPSRFVWQPPANDNVHNAHISSWTQTELSALGWVEITPMVGLHFLYGPYAKRKVALSGSRLDLLRASIETLFLRWKPKYAFSYVATKRGQNPRIAAFDSDFKVSNFGKPS